MRKWLFKHFGIIKRRHFAEYEILENVVRMNISDSDKDDIVDIVKTALDRQFR